MGFMLAAWGVGAASVEAGAATPRLQSTGDVGRAPWVLEPAELVQIQSGLHEVLQRVRAGSLNGEPAVVELLNTVEELWVRFVSGGILDSHFRGFLGNGSVVKVPSATARRGGATAGLIGTRGTQVDRVDKSAARYWPGSATTARFELRDLVGLRDLPDWSGFAVRIQTEGYQGVNLQVVERPGAGPTDWRLRASWARVVPGAGTKAGAAVPGLPSVAGDLCLLEATAERVGRAPPLVRAKARRLRWRHQPRLHAAGLIFDHVLPRCHVGVAETPR